MTDVVEPVTWRILFADVATKQLKKLDREIARRIAQTLRELVASGDPRSRGKPLAGPLSGHWRYRVGDYRVICELRDSELVVLVLQVGHRSRVYED